jgi:hypothetical protein
MKITKIGKVPSLERTKNSKGVATLIRLNAKKNDLITTDDVVRGQDNTHAQEIQCNGILPRKLKHPTVWYEKFQGLRKVRRYISLKWHNAHTKCHENLHTKFHVNVNLYPRCYKAEPVVHTATDRRQQAFLGYTTDTYNGPIRCCLS